MEALAIGIIGLLLGVAAGAVNLYYMLTRRRSESFAGIALEYTFPFGIVALAGARNPGRGVRLALFPAESAVRSSLVEALEYE